MIDQQAVFTAQARAAQKGFLDFREVNCVLAEDDQSVFFYLYPDGATARYVAVELPSPVDPRSFDPQAWAAAFADIKHRGRMH